MQKFSSSLRLSRAGFSALEVLFPTCRRKEGLQTLPLKDPYNSPVGYELLSPFIIHNRRKLGLGREITQGQQLVRSKGLESSSSGSISSAVNHTMLLHDPLCLGPQCPLQTLTVQLALMWVCSSSARNSSRHPSTLSLVTHGNIFIRPQVEAQVLYEAAEQGALHAFNSLGINGKYNYTTS